jgi:hypothetical protein
MASRRSPRAIIVSHDEVLDISELAQSSPAEVEMEGGGGTRPKGRDRGDGPRTHGSAGVAGAGDEPACTEQVVWVGLGKAH